MIAIILTFHSVYKRNLSFLYNEIEWLFFILRDVRDKIKEMCFISFKQ